MTIAQKIIAELQLHGRPIKVVGALKFFKTGKGEYAEGDKFWAVTVPEQRKIAGAFFTDTTADDIAFLLAHPYHEARLTGVFILVKKFEKAKKQADRDFWANVYLNNLGGINNWDLVDSSAHKILGPWLENGNRDVLYKLAESENLWHKRISMIATMHFIKKNDFDDALALAAYHLHHPHDLMHKAVGWMLREIGKKHLPTEEAFLEKIYRTMPRTALRYAIEKFTEQKRKDYLYGNI